MGIVQLMMTLSMDRHKAVNIWLKLYKNERGPGHWKLNSKLLEIQEYNDMTVGIITDCKVNPTNLGGQMNWEVMKVRVRESSIKYGALRAKKRKEKIKKIQNNLDFLNKQEDLGIHIDKENRDKVGFYCMLLFFTNGAPYYFAKCYILDTPRPIINKVFT